MASQHIRIIKSKYGDRPMHKLEKSVYYRDERGWNYLAWLDEDDLHDLIKMAMDALDEINNDALFK